MSTLPRDLLSSLGALPTILTRWREPVQRVTLELGDERASILAEVQADGAVRLGLGSNTDFRGYHRDLPVAIGTAARDILDVSAPLVRRMPVKDAVSVPDHAWIRFSLTTPRAEYGAAPRSAELKSGRSPLVPLWFGFSQMIPPLLAFLSPTDPREAAPAHRPALVLAYRIWAVSGLDGLRGSDGPR